MVSARLWYQEVTPSLESLQTQVAKPRMLIRSAAQRPPVLALRFRDRKVIDGRKPRGHETGIVELPVLIPVGPVPLTRIVVPFVSKAHRDAIPRERPQLLDEPIVQLLRPLARKKSDDLASSVEELRAVSSARIDRVGQRYFPGITTVPGVFSPSHLLYRAFARKRRHRRPGGGCLGCHGYAPFTSARILGEDIVSSFDRHVAGEAGFE